MNKKDIMRQSSMELLLEEMIKHKPGVTSTRLFEAAKEWAGKSWDSSDTYRFDVALHDLRERGYLCTNKQWYPKGHVAEPNRHGPSKAHPRQTRMDW